MLNFDKNLRYQQNFEMDDLPVIVRDAGDHTYLGLALLMGRVLEALGSTPVAGSLVIR